MEKLIVKPNSTKKEARDTVSLGLVYNCPVCRVGHSLVHLSSETVKCNICKGEFKKP